MICRREGEGWLLIAQPAHAWLSGELCTYWGNENFAVPAPFKAVLLATHLHDIGWATWDAFPRLGSNGQPVSFLETTLDETIPIWYTAVQQVSLFDLYAALLVSMHAATIYRRRLERKIDPPEERPNAEAMLAEQVNLQNELRAQLTHHTEYSSFAGQKQSSRAYRWLRVCDLLSLALCADFMPQSGVIESVPGNELHEFFDVHYNCPRPFELNLDPYPLNQPSIQATVQVRRLGESTFRNQADFLAALESAAWFPQTIEVSKG
jgi:hypothetical protein